VTFLDLRMAEGILSSRWKPGYGAAFTCNSSAW
jgi:hypothetical protein